MCLNRNPGSQSTDAADSLYELDGEAKKLDAQSHKLEVNNSVVSVQTVLCVHCTIYVTVSILCH